jgi:hypothetical protein
MTWIPFLNIANEATTAQLAGLSHTRGVGRAPQSEVGEFMDVNPIGST